MSTNTNMGIMSAITNNKYYGHVLQQFQLLQQQVQGKESEVGWRGASQGKDRVGMRESWVDMGCQEPVLGCFEISSIKSERRQSSGSWQQQSQYKLNMLTNFDTDNNVRD